jgi:hypothetical protein
MCVNMTFSQYCSNNIPLCVLVFRCLCACMYIVYVILIYVSVTLSTTLCRSSDANVWIRRKTSNSHTFPGILRTVVKYEIVTLVFCRYTMKDVAWMNIILVKLSNSNLEWQTTSQNEQFIVYFSILCIFYFFQLSFCENVCAFYTIEVFLN